VNEIITDWLRKQFIRVPDVRYATSEADTSLIYQTHQADLVIATWMGARLHIYLQQQAPRIRDIKNTLKENSRSSIGTLYILNQQLLPAHNTILKVSDWQEALFSLNEGWIYSYTLTDDGLSITQAHFSPTTNKGEYRCWYLEDFAIESVSVRKRSLQSGIKGTWYIGDITSTAYKRRVHHERASQRFHYRTKYTQGIPGQNPKQLRKREGELAQHYQLLGVDKNASEGEIKRAYRRMAMQVHPDVSALPRAEADRRFKQLNEAYEFIKQYHGWA